MLHWFAENGRQGGKVGWHWGRRLRRWWPPVALAAMARRCGVGVDVWGMKPWEVSEFTYKALGGIGSLGRFLYLRKPLAS
ncbi:hypothetical protein U1Q18_010020 [Sarracenia purpurea var. burkii]